MSASWITPQDALQFDVPEVKPVQNTAVIIQSGVSFLKAELRLESINHQSVVIKDYSRYVGTLWSPLTRYLMKREARVLESLQGWAHAPRFLGYQGSHAFAMEYVDGYRVNQVRKRGLPVKFGSVLKLVSDLHRQGIYHNDFRNTNLLFSKDGRLVLVDYGAAVCIPRLSVLAPLHRALRLINIASVMKLKKQFTARPLTHTQRCMLMQGRRIKRFFRSIKSAIKRK